VLEAQAEQVAYPVK